MCRLVIGSRRFEGTYRLHSQGSSDPRKIRLSVPGPLKTKKNYSRVIKMKRNRSLNTTNGLLAKMESSYVTTCFGLFCGHRQVSA